MLVTVTYRVTSANQDAFREAMTWVRRSRLRTGATRWALYRDGAAPDRFVEVYEVPSWQEHLRQHSGRLTGSDQMREERARALVAEPPRVAHLFPADTPDRMTSPR